MSGEEDKNTTKDEGINVKGAKQLVKKEEPLPVKEEQLQGSTGPTMSDEGATVTVGDTKDCVLCCGLCVNPIREIEKWETIVSENKEIYIAPEFVEFLIKNPGLVARAPTLFGSRHVEGFWDLKMRRTNLGSYQMSWELREENMWRDLHGKVWLKKRKAAEPEPEPYKASRVTRA